MDFYKAVGGLIACGALAIAAAFLMPDKSWETLSIWNILVIGGAIGVLRFTIAICGAVRNERF